MYVALLVPTLFPFSFHWYAGVAPPLVGVAVNVTLVPAHIGEAGAPEIPTEGVKMGFTVILIELLETVAALTHPSDEVRSQVTTAPLSKPLLV